MKQTLYGFAVSVLLLGAGCSAHRASQAPAVPSMLPDEAPVVGVPAEVITPQYWIDRLDDPDKVIMTQDDIVNFNNTLLDQHVVLDVTDFRDVIPGGGFRTYLAANARQLATANLFVTGDIPLEQSERTRIIARIDTLSIRDEIPVRFGMTLHHVMGRVWPTDILLMNAPGDNEFDQGVSALVEMATPVALVHTSPDGLWSFVQTPGFLCWLPSESVVFGDRETVQRLIRPATPLVATTDEVTVYASPDISAALGSLRMGAYLPLNTAGMEYFQVTVPVRGADGKLAAGSGYIRCDAGISIDFLPYTFRNAYTQAFALLGTRYGWGGMNGDRDCSSYILSIFRCFNIQLPANSLSQVKASPALIPLDVMTQATRLDLLRVLPGGLSLLKLAGPIMLYLGEAYGKPYAIHEFWSWREPGGKKKPDITHRVARVAVTDFQLGAGSQKGSYLERLTHAGILGYYEIY